MQSTYINSDQGHAGAEEGCDAADQLHPTREGEVSGALLHRMGDEVESLSVFILQEQRTIKEEFEVII